MAIQPSNRQAHGWGREAAHTFRTENPVSSAIGTNPHRRRNGKVNGRGGSDAILNSRPFTPAASDPKDDEPITPNYLLLQTASAIPTPGVFGKDDWYARGRRWQIQWMADQFWRRWSREYLPALLPRQKWTTKRSNIQLCDVVLIAGDGHSRNNWQMGGVYRVFPDSRNIVRQVEVKTANGTFRPPIAKLCLVCRGDENIMAAMSEATISD